MVVPQVRRVISAVYILLHASKPAAFAELVGSVLEHGRFRVHWEGSVNSATVRAAIHPRFHWRRAALSMVLRPAAAAC